MFDAYHKWLGIPPGAEARPPTHYQLLGIARDERDAEVIESAAIRQMAYVRNFQSGAHAKECARILGELSQARLTLRDPAKRAEYDATLAPPTLPDVPTFTLPGAPAMVAPAPVVHALAVETIPIRERTSGGGGLLGAIVPLGVAACLLAGVGVLGMNYLNRPKDVANNIAPKPPIIANPATTPRLPVPENLAVLEIVTEPARATVTATGMRARRTPDAATGKLVLELPEADGKRPLTLASIAPGYREFKQIVVPKPGERRALRLKLEPSEEAVGGGDNVGIAKATTPTPPKVATMPKGRNGLPLAVGPSALAAGSGDDEEMAHPEPKVVSTPAVRFKEAFGPIRCLAIHPEGLRAATGHEDGGLRSWSLQKGTFLKRLDGHKAAVVGMAFSPDGKRLVSAGADGMIRLWDAKTGKELGKRPTGKADVHAIAYGPGGLAITAVAGQVAILDLSRPNPIRSWDVGVGTWVTGLAVSIKARLILTGDSGGRVEVHDAETGNRPQFIPTQDGEVGALAIAEDGRLGLAARQDGPINLIDLRTGQVLRKLKGHEGRVLGAAFAPDGKRAISGGEDGTLRLWDVKGGFETHRFEGHEGAIAAVAFTPDGKQALSGGADKILRLWDVPDAVEDESP